jgi:hypothetical protein
LIQNPQATPKELLLRINGYEFGHERELVRHFLYLTKLLGITRNIEEVTSDDSLPGKWSKNEIIVLPKDRKY